MLRFIGRRLGFVALTLLLASLIIFVATEVLPGDVATEVLGRFATQEAKQALRKELGLNRPLAVQYGDWLSHFVRGNWGTSISTQTGVRGLVLERVRNSAILAGTAMLFYVPLGILFGLIAALRRRSWIDNLLSISSLSFIGLPEFVIALVLLTVFSIRLGWLPSQSAIDPQAGLLQNIQELILPAATIALGELAYVLRMTRASTVEVLRADYVRTASLKGLPPRKVLFTHVLRNALLPTVTVVAIGVGWLIGGMIVTESIFAYPGVGRLLLFAIQHRDVPLVQASALIIVAIFCLANLVADIVYALLNPRIRYG
jgi:peptide/nickel transport system permease protein